MSSNRPLTKLLVSLSLVNEHEHQHRRIHDPSDKLSVFNTQQALTQYCRDHYGLTKATGFFVRRRIGGALISDGLGLMTPRDIKIEADG
jgi:hypothetical protein